MPFDYRLHSGLPVTETIRPLGEGPFPIDGMPMAAKSKIGQAFRRVPVTPIAIARPVVAISAPMLSAIWWDGQGACMVMKRLEQGRFVWPSAKEGKVVLTPAQLSMLLEGMRRIRQ